MSGVWLLVLTIISSHGVSVSQVGPFPDLTNCQKAADAWVKRNKSLVVDANALCVKRFQPTGFGVDQSER